MSADDLIVTIETEDARVTVDNLPDVRVKLAQVPDVHVSANVDVVDISLEVQVDNKVSFVIQDPPEVDLEVKESADIILLATANVGPPGPQGPPGGKAFSKAIGDGSSKAFVIQHDFDTRAITVSVYRANSPYDEVEAEIERTDVNYVTVRTTTVPGINEYIVLIAAAGEGIPGPPGPAGGDVTYVHTQTVLSNNWVINHNLGKYPSVSVVDSGNTEIIPDVRYTSLNQVSVIFGSATSGKAYLN